MRLIAPNELPTSTYGGGIAAFSNRVWSSIIRCLLVRDTSGNAVGSAVTDANGNYCIKVAAPPAGGAINYIVEEVQQPGCVQTFGNVGLTVTGPLTYGNLNFGNFCDVIRPRLDFTLSGGRLCVSWTGDAVLESTASLNTPITWTPLADQTNPQCLLPVGQQRFFRLRTP